MLPPLLVFIIVLSLLIFFHEFGHFLAAKWSGIKVEEFGFGYPPRLWGKKVGETVYSLNLIPFGGFVRLLGQELKDRKELSDQQKQRAFFAKSKRTRSLVLLAGVIGNFLLGVICFTIIYSRLGIPKKLGYVRIVEVVKNGPAATAGIKGGERVRRIEGQPVKTIGQFVELIDQYQGEMVEIETDKAAYQLKPRENPPAGQGSLGVVITDVKMVSPPWWQVPFLSAFEGTKEAVSWIVMVSQGIGLSLRQLIAGRPPAVTGPVGIFQLTTRAAEQGILELIQFTGILSVNLAVLNLLPIPALDGGHLVLVFLGGLTSEERREKIERTASLIGFAFLISLMVAVTVSDLARVLKDSTLLTFFNELVNRF